MPGDERRSAVPIPPSAIPKGFRFAAVEAGIRKSGGADLALIVSETMAAAAAAFTTNRVQAAPLVVSRAHLRRSGGPRPPPAPPRACSGRALSTSCWLPPE